MRRAVLLCGAASFIMAFLGGFLAVTLASPSPATAFSSQPPEVRASSFVLVGPDGDTVLGRWAAGPSGGGNLTLHDADGTRRQGVGGGQFETLGPDGTLAFKAGRTTEAYTGAVPVNGVLLGPGGTVGMLPSR
jgi:hypothetical protein